MSTEVLFLAGRLDMGGAERQFSVLVRGLGKTKNVEVVTFFDGGEFWDELVKDGSVRVESLLGERPGSRLGRIFKYLWLIPSLRKRFREINPQRVFSLLFLPNVLAFFGLYPWGLNRLVWSMRTTDAISGTIDGICRKVSCWLSGNVNLMVANSSSGAEFLRDFGFRCSDITVIPNGIDTVANRIDDDRRVEFRRCYSINSQDFVVGIVSRVVPLKNHELFIQAAKKCLNDVDGAKFLIVGGKGSVYSNRIRRMAEDELGDKVIWIDCVDDLLDIYNGMDLLVSCSSNEGFSNVIGEAMACGTPCVVSNVGDSRRIVGQLGESVAVGSCEELTRALIRSYLRKEELAQQRTVVRKRIEEEFSVEKMVRGYERVL